MRLLSRRHTQKISEDFMVNEIIDFSTLKGRTQEFTVKVMAATQYK